MQCNNSPMIRHHSFFKSVLLFAALSLPAAAFSSAADDKAFDSLHFNWKALRLADAIKEVRGDGARVIAVFTEPECGYCRKYEKTLAQVDNVTIYRFLMPLDPNRSRASVTVWCAGDTDEQRLEALTVAMQNANLFPSMVIQMVSIGEETGALDGMLGKVADFYEAEVDDAVEALSSLMEPMIMVVLGTLIGVLPVGRAPMVTFSGGLF